MPTRLGTPGPHVTILTGCVRVCHPIYRWLGMLPSLWVTLSDLLIVTMKS